MKKHLFLLRALTWLTGGASQLHAQNTAFTCQLRPGDSSAGAPVKARGEA